MEMVTIVNVMRSIFCRYYYVLKLYQLKSYRKSKFSNLQFLTTSSKIIIVLENENYSYYAISLVQIGKQVPYCVA